MNELNQYKYKPKLGGARRGSRAVAPFTNMI